jgi:hypothetical protein
MKVSRTGRRRGCLKRGGPRGLRSSCNACGGDRAAHQNHMYANMPTAKTLPAQQCKQQGCSRAAALSNAARQLQNKCEQLQLPGTDTDTLTGASRPIELCCEQARGRSICTPIARCCKSLALQHQQNHKRCSQWAAIRSRHGHFHEPCTCHEHCREHAAMNRPAPTPRMLPKQCCCSNCVAYKRTARNTACRGSAAAGTECPGAASDTHKKALQTLVSSKREGRPEQQTHTPLR